VFRTGVKNYPKKLEATSKF